MRSFGLVGKTLKHSFSKKYFEEKFAAEHLTDCIYLNYELEDINKLNSLLKQPGLSGLNVTIPYKEAVIPFLTHINDVVRETGACNCIKIRNGKISGFNTDAIAFLKLLQNNDISPKEQALVLGSGGASKAIQYALKMYGIHFKKVSRKKSADGLVYDELEEEIMRSHLLIINTTPVGMFPHEDDYPAISYEFLGAKHILIDLVYNPPKTRFLQLGEDKGAKIMNGHEMLVLQAEESWRIWNDSSL